MILLPTFIAFNMEDGDGLAALVESGGYTKPTKGDPVARSQKYDNASLVEVERHKNDNADQCFITIHADSVQTLPKAMSEVLSDFKKLGIIK